MVKKKKKKGTRPKRRQVSSAMKSFYEGLKSGKYSRYTKGEDDLKAMGLRAFKITPDSHFLAILPNPDNPDVYAHEIYIHYDVNKTGSYLCPEKNFNEMCPVCEYRKALEAEGEPDEVTGSLNPGRKYLIYVVDMTDRKTIRKGPQLLAAPYSVMAGFADAATDQRTGAIIDITDPDTAVNVVFKRTGTSMQATEYSAFGIEDRTDKLPSKYAKSLPSFEEVMEMPNVEKMAEAINFDLEEDSKKLKRKKRVKPEPEEDEDEEYEDEEEEEEFEDEPDDEPDEDEDEPDDDPDEDEDEPDDEPDEEDEEEEEEWPDDEDDEEEEEEEEKVKPRRVKKGKPKRKKRSRK